MKEEANNRDMIELYDRFKKANMSQAAFCRKAEAMGIKISESTMTNLRKGVQISGASIKNILTVLGLTRSEFYMEIDREDEPEKESEKTSSYRGGFITDKNDPAYNGYTGYFHVYFFHTQKEREDLLHGILHLSDEVNENGFFNASLILYTGSVSSDNKLMEKHYKGGYIISKPMLSVYCYLEDEDFGEISFIVFDHFHIRKETLHCKLGSAITVSSGVQKIPTLHRIMLCRKELTGEQTKIIRGQLRLNSPKIILTKQKYKELQESRQLSEAFQDKLRDSVRLESFYVVQESSLISEESGGLDFEKSLSILKDYSIAPQYNKVGRRSNLQVFELYRQLTSVLQPVSGSEKSTDKNKN